MKKEIETRHQLQIKKKRDDEKLLVLDMSADENDIQNWCPYEYNLEDWYIEIGIIDPNWRDWLWSSS
jgi:hypothetical protein